MIRVTSQLQSLLDALCLPNKAGAPIAVDPVEVHKLARGMYRKVAFMKMHLALLQGIEWARVDGIGRITTTGSPDHLTIALAEASLTCSHPGAVIDHVYVAFDGYIAALANLTDTLGRLINSAYGLGLNARRASLLSVRDKCGHASALGTVLHNPVHTDWLVKVRDLRGRCQHADVEEVLRSPTGSYAQRGQPLVEAQYCLALTMVDTPMLAYASQAIVAAEATLGDSIAAVLSQPTDPIR